ncbi:MAG: hypothetical protein ACYC0X_24170 [Pirellulaceae bacterium]
MSDTWIIFIPTDRHFAPSRDAQGRSVALLRQFLPTADEIEAECDDEIRFIDCGGNWMGVTCPECGADAEPWFGAALSAVSKATRFRDLGHVAPCCGRRVFLDNLNFGWPVGFARFSLEAKNPGLERAELEASQHKALQDVLECPLRVVWRHI